MKSYNGLPRFVAHACDYYHCPLLDNTLWCNCKHELQLKGREKSDGRTIRPVW